MCVYININIYIYGYSINLKRKKKHRMPLKIKGTKIISPLPIQKQTSFGTGRGNVMRSCSYNTGSSHVVMYFSLLSKKIAAAFPLLEYVRMYVYLKPLKRMN